MSALRPVALAAALCLCLGAGVGTAVAQDDDRLPPERERQSDPMPDGLLGQLFSTLQELLQEIPQYEMPEINEDGDIIIRRKRPEPEPPAHAVQPEAVET